MKTKPARAATTAPVSASSTAQPQGCTNFKLRQLLRSVARLYDAQLARTGLKTTQYSLLSHVVALGPVAPKELATQMGLDASTLTRNLRPLVEQGWCAQGPGVDARSRSISVTGAGRAKHAEARAHWKRAQLALNQRLGDEQVVALHRMIEAVQAALLDAGAAPATQG